MSAEHIEIAKRLVMSSLGLFVTYLILRVVFAALLKQARENKGR